MCSICETGLPAYIVSFAVAPEEKPAPGNRAISFVTLTLDKDSAEAMASVYRKTGIEAYVRPVRLGPKDLGMLGDLLAHATEWDTRELVTPSKAVDS